MQYVIHRYHHISKEVVELFTIPNNLAFENQFKFQPDARKLYEEYQTMFSSAAPKEKGFPYLAQLVLLFKMGEKMQTVKNVHDNIFQLKQV